MLAITTPASNGMTAQATRLSVNVMIGAMMNTSRFGAARDDRLLDQELEPVGEGLQQPERADDVRPLAQLRERQHLALGIGQVGDREQQRHDDRQHLADGNHGRQRVAAPKASHASRSVPMAGAAAR